MEQIINFFTNTLSGTTYIVVLVICIILFCACIGYLAERSLQKKKKEEDYVNVSMDTYSMPSTAEINAEVGNTKTENLVNQELVSSPTVTPETSVSNVSTATSPVVEQLDNAPANNQPIPEVAPISINTNQGVSTTASPVVDQLDNAPVNNQPVPEVAPISINANQGVSTATSPVVDQLDDVPVNNQPVPEVAPISINTNQGVSTTTSPVVEHLDDISVNNQPIPEVVAIDPIIDISSSVESTQEN